MKCYVLELLRLRPGGIALLPLLVPLASHVGPSPTQNNRYAKIVLSPDSVRVAYTAYFGERPGAAERIRMDENKNGVIEPAEAEALGHALVAEIAPSLRLEIDGEPPSTKWSLADVGLGTPSVTGGAFSVDLAITIPLAKPAAWEHVVWLDDLWTLPFPGESETRIEEAPGVRVVEAHLGRGGSGMQLRFTHRGPPGRPGERGILIKYLVDAPLAAERVESTGRRVARRPRMTWIAVGALAFALVGWAAVSAGRLRRGNRERNSST